MGTREIERGPVAIGVSARVEHRREALHLSQRELGERLAAVGRPMQVSAISKVESGARRVDVDDLVALADALNTTTTYLLTGVEPPSNPAQAVEDIRANYPPNVWSSTLRLAMDAAEARVPAALVVSALEFLISTFEGIRAEEGTQDGER